MTKWKRIPRLNTSSLSNATLHKTIHYTSIPASVNSFRSIVTQSIWMDGWLNAYVAAQCLKQRRVKNTRYQVIQGAICVSPWEQLSLLWRCQYHQESNLLRVCFCFSNQDNRRVWRCTCIFCLEVVPRIATRMLLPRQKYQAVPLHMHFLIAFLYVVCNAMQRIAFVCVHSKQSESKKQ